MIGRRVAVLLAVALAAGTARCGGDDSGGEPLPPGSPSTTGAYYHTAVDLNPSLYWRLDEPDSETAATDVSGENHNGYWAGDLEHGQPGAVDGDSSVVFDPVGDITYARAYNYSPYARGGQFTVVGITKIDAFKSDFQTLFSSDGPENNQSTLEVGKPVVRWYSNVQSGYFAANYDWLNAWPGKGSWVWWAFTWDDTKTDAQLFVNGVRQQRSKLLAGATQFAGNEGNFQIGNRGNGDYEILNGSMDEIVVFERVLKDAELEAMFRASGL